MKKKWLTNYLDEMNLLKEATVEHCVASLVRLFHSEITVGKNECWYDRVLDWGIEITCLLEERVL
jgi:hypothetical protein